MHDVHASRYGAGADYGAVQVRALAFIGWSLIAISPLGAQAFTSPTVTPADLQAAAAQNLAIMAATTPQFVGGSSAYQTRAQLAASYPCNASNLGKLGNVNDAFGALSTTLVCLNDGLAFNYQPYNEASFATVVTQTSGAVSLVPLSTAPVIYFSATPTGTMTVTPSTVGAYLGETFHVYAPASLGLGAINLSGVIGGGTVPLAQGSDKILTYTSSGWKSN